MDHGCEGIWVLAEQAEGQIQRISHELLARGRTLADKRRTDLTAILMGANVPAEQLDGLIARGADRVLYLEAPQLEHFLVEPHARALLHAIAERRPEILLAGATSTGRTLLPYVAIKANTGLTADCTILDVDPQTGDLIQTRPAIGGNILATILTPRHRPQMATVRPHSTPPAEPASGRRGRIERMAVPPELLRSRMRRVGFEPDPDPRGLQDAQRVVTCGRGIKKADNLPLVRELAEVLDAALGATRDVVDRGWLSYPHQVGLSGKTVTPRLYVGVGASGSIQHLAGMQTSETIVAINRDPEAAIFQVADFGIVGDLFEVVPALIEHLREFRQGPGPAGAVE